MIMWVMGITLPYPTWYWNTFVFLLLVKQEFWFAIRKFGPLYYEAKFLYQKKIAPVLSIIFE